MTVQLKKLLPVELRSLGLDEKWLQERIVDDPAVLGLGALEIVGREHRQPLGGRIDFLMRAPESETFYEIEVMLGALDESHIIRGIEYWDIERQRRPQFDHRAVIVAEQITSRFFNVLRLLHRAVPLIAVKLSAFQPDDGSIVIHPVKVLDVIEEIADVDTVDQAEQADRPYWEKKSAAASLGVMDSIVSSLKAGGMEPRITYNRYHIAVGTTGYNFGWFYPRKTIGHCYVECRVGADARESILTSLQEAGVDASPVRADKIGFGLTTQALQEHSKVIVDVLKHAEEASRR
jgi:hypothetical protein